MSEAIKAETVSEINSVLVSKFMNSPSTWSTRYVFKILALPAFRFHLLHGLNPGEVDFLKNY